jgi:hypothetical protein
MQDIAMSAMCIGEALGQIKEAGLIDKQTIPEGRETLHLLVVAGHVLISALAQSCPGNTRLFDVRCCRSATNSRRTHPHKL